MDTELTLSSVRNRTKKARERWHVVADEFIIFSLLL